jgi:hypothetical protein
VGADHPRTLVERAFAAVGEMRPHALIVLSDGVTQKYPHRLVEHAARIKQDRTAEFPAWVLLGVKIAARCVPLAQLPCTAPGLGSSQTVAADVLGFAPARPERFWQWSVDAAGRPVREVEPLAVLGPVDAALYVLPL